MSRGRWEDYDHSDKETDVYDQCCDNCGRQSCPMILPETAENHYEEYGTLEDFDSEEAEKLANEVRSRRMEDAVIRDDEPAWCIYWKERGRLR